MVKNVILILSFIILFGCSTIPDNVTYKDRGPLIVDFDLDNYEINNYNELVKIITTKSQNIENKTISIISSNSTKTVLLCFSTMKFNPSSKLPTGGKANYPLRYTLSIITKNDNITFQFSDYVILNTIKTLIINKQFSEKQLIREFQSEILELVM